MLRWVLWVRLLRKHACHRHESSSGSVLRSRDAVARSAWAHHWWRTTHAEAIVRKCVSFWGFQLFIKHFKQQQKSVREAICGVHQQDTFVMQQCGCSCPRVLESNRIKVRWGQIFCCCSRPSFLCLHIHLQTKWCRQKKNLLSIVQRRIPLDGEVINAVTHLQTNSVPLTVWRFLFHADDYLSHNAGEWGVEGRLSNCSS